MTNERFAHPNVTLTREEVKLILNLIGRRFILGLADEPAKEIAEEAAKYGLVYAGRSLRARGLARLMEDEGEKKLRIREDVLRMVAVCAQPQVSFVYSHVPEGSRIGEMVFAHLNGESIIRHYLPEAVLHHFEQLPDLSTLLEDFGRVAGLPQESDLESDGFYAEASLLSAIKEAAIAGRQAHGISLLTDLTDENTATALMETLAADYAFTKLQVILQLEGNQQGIRHVTFIAKGETAWLDVETNPEDDKEGSEPRHFVRPVSLETGTAYLSAMLAMPTN